MSDRFVDQSKVSVADLRSAISGRVITPQDPDFDKARAVFYRWFDRRPALIVRPANAADVVRVIALARDSGLPLAVRGGGHSVAGHSVLDGGVVLDLSGMKALEIDVQNRSAWAEAGLTTGEYTVAAGAHGLATGFGDTPSVGIGGLTLGGGIGYLVRKHGLTIDSLLAADVVTADGQSLRADLETHPDLFWALRGGGGNFGVVTRFHYRLHEVGTVVGGMLVLPATADVIQSLVAEAEAAPDELSMIANVISPAPPMPFIPQDQQGKPIIMLMMVYAGDLEAGERAVAPFRALATPLADMVRPMPYPDMFQSNEGGPEPVADAARTMFLDGFGRREAETVVDYLASSRGSMSVAQIRALGGQMARVPVEATAFAHRKRPIMVAMASLYENLDEAELHENWVSSFMTALRRDSSGVYVNFLGEEGEARVHEAYPASVWDRLAEVKARYDPANLFRGNHNIPPAGKVTRP